MKNNGKKLSVLAGIAAAEAYRFYKGKGIFNTVRFKKQHKAASDYIAANYPGAFYSAITETENGWSCVVSSHGRKIVLYMTCGNDGNFIFWEKDI